MQWGTFHLAEANLERVGDGYKFKCATKGACMVAQFNDNLKYFT